MKIISACLKLYANHFITFLVVAVMIPLFSMATNNPTLFSAITAFIYVSLAYSAVWTTGMKDARRIEGYHPSWKVPAIISVIVSVVPVALFVMCIAAPDLWKSEVHFLCGEVDFFITGYRFSNTPDCLFRLWFMHLGTFIPNGNMFAYFCAIFFLPAIIFAGYGIGLKRFKITEYLYGKIVFSGNRGENKNRRFGK